MQNPNFDQVSIVASPDPECDDCPEDCKQQVWTISVGGVVLADASSEHGVLNFLNDYIPGFQQQIVSVRDALDIAVVLHDKMQALQIHFRELVDKIDAETPPEGN